MNRITSGLLAALALLAAGAASAGPAPQQRGAVIGAPAHSARAVVTLCGLAVLMVEDSAGQSASLYAGSSIDERLSAPGIDYQEYELARMYTPVAAACESILAEHERILRERASKGAGD